MEIISKRKHKHGETVVVRETAQEKAANIIPILERELARCTVLERPAIEKKLKAWKAKL
jgi:hypothetical protein